MARARILVSGGRDLTNYKLVRDTLDTIVIDRGWIYDDDYNMPNVVLIHGGAEGADLLADQWGVVNWLEIEEYKADWDKYGKAAGMIRNRQMLEEGKPDLVVAFPTKNSIGTWGMIKIAREAGVETIVIRP